MTAFTRKQRYTYATTLTWGGDVQTGELDIEVSYSVSDAIPPRGPSYSSGGEPGEPAIVEDIIIEKAHGVPWAQYDGWGGLGLTKADAEDTILDALIPDHEDAMLAVAWEQDESDLDEWHDLKRQEREEDERWNRDFIDDDLIDDHDDHGGTPHDD